MTNFEQGDIVRFKGDDVDYKVTFKNSNGTCDLLQIGSNEEEIEYVPVRLIEHLPVPVEVGQVWESYDSLFATGEDKHRLFVTRVDGEDDVSYVIDWDMHVSKCPARYIREHYTLILKGA